MEDEERLNFAAEAEAQRILGVLPVTRDIARTLTNLLAAELKRKHKLLRRLSDLIPEDVGEDHPAISEMRRQMLPGIEYQRNDPSELLKELIATQDINHARLDPVGNSLFVLPQDLKDRLVRFLEGRLPNPEIEPVWDESGASAGAGFHK